MARTGDRRDTRGLSEAGGQANRGRCSRILGRLHRDPRGARDSRAAHVQACGRREVRAARLPQRFNRRHRHAGTAGRARACRLGERGIGAPDSKGSMSMARVAIVTGGTRGIGEAISIALRDMGMQVAANYAGNDERARAFTERTGIKAYKWDVADYEACQEGVRKVEAELGPVDVLVNNAGITRDATMRKMDHGKWQEVIDTNL